MRCPLPSGDIRRKLLAMEIIDAHVHLGAWDHPAFRPLSTDLAGLVRAERAAGVSAVALTTSDQADNGALLAAGRACPMPHWLFLWARPSEPAELEALLSAHPGAVRGLKIHPSLERLALDDPGWDPIFALAEAADLAVMVHTGRWQQIAGFGLALDRAARHPKVTFVLSHAGGDTAPLCLAAAEQVSRARLDNVAFDTAGLREHWALERAVRRAGYQRYLMGSDYPLAHPAMYVAQFEALDLPEAWREAMLGKNARELLGEPSQPARSMPPPRPRIPRLRAEHTVLVTGAGGPIGVNLTRSLRLCKRPLRLLGSDANPLHRPLALTDRCFALPPARDPAYLERLNALIDAQGVDMVFPTHPVEVRALSALREQVRARLFLPPHQTILLGQDKAASYRAFAEAGVPVPRSLLIAGPEDIHRAFAELGPPPVWFRGSGVPGAGIGVASLPCSEAGVARAWVEHHRGYGQFLASEFLPGDNLTWLSVWHQGTLWASQSRQRLEYVIPHVSPSGVTGAPAVARTVNRPEVRAAGEAAVRAVCDEPPHGIFFVDLKADRQGVVRVTEINAGRFGTTLHFYTEAGFNFPELALELCFHRLPRSPMHEPIPADTYWIRTLDCGPVLLPGSALEKE